MAHRSGVFSLVLVAAGAFAVGAWVFRTKPVTTITAPARALVLTSNEKNTAMTGMMPARGPAIAVDARREELVAALRAKLPGSPEDFLRSLEEIGKTNPSFAIDLAHELGRTEAEKTAWVTNAMQQWADRDPAGAWQWLRQLTKDRMQELAGGELGGVVLGAMTARDPRMVVAGLDDLLRNGNVSESVSTPVAVHLGLAALIEHGKIDLAKTAVDAWARDPRQFALEAAAFETVSASLVRTQPRETAEWLRSLPATDERNAAFATFAAAWAKSDPRAALTWTETLAPGEGQQAALRRTVSDWIEEFPDQVSGWLGDYLTRAPAGPAADSLIETVINNSPTLRTAPRAALQWANLISDPAKQIDYHEIIAVRWAEQDASAALAFVNQSTVIPAARKPAVVNRIQMTQVAGKPGS
jgi:hypothetical protein